MCIASYDTRVTHTHEKTELNLIKQFKVQLRNSLLCSNVIQSLESMHQTVPSGKNFKAGSALGILPFYVQILCITLLMYMYYWKSQLYTASLKQCSLHAPCS